MTTSPNFYRLLAFILAIGSAIESVAGLLNNYTFDAAIVFTVSWVAIAILLVASEFAELNER